MSGTAANLSSLYLYYFDPHVWYNPPAPYDTLYDATYTGTLTADVYQDSRPVVEGNLILTPRDIEHLIALYDGSITYWDTHFGEMMAFLDSMGLLANSIVILTSDHGEMFGEHGLWAHRGSLYEEIPQPTQPMVLPAHRLHLSSLRAK